MTDDAVAWLRKQVEARRALARDTIGLGNNAEWRELSSGVLVTGDGTDGDHWDGTWAMGDSTLTRLMAANDPRDTIARCEAELAVLDDHYPAPNGWGRLTRKCSTCKDQREDYPEEWVSVASPCRPLRLLASAYRHRQGWAEHWG